jgi:two-component system, chemotaxis family, sensor kinase CheA
MDDKELLKRLRKVFIQEAKERLTSISTNLIILGNKSKKVNYPEILEIVYRDAHSLKGAARSINLSTIETVFQTIESLFNKVKNNQAELSQEISDYLLNLMKKLDRIISSADEIESNENNELLSNFENGISQFLNTGRIETFNKSKPVDPPPEKIIVQSINSEEFVENIPKIEKKEKIEKSSAEIDETIRIVAKKLDSLLIKSESLILIKFIFREQHKLLLDLYKLLKETGKCNKNIQKDYVAILTGLQETISFDKRKSRKSLSNIINYLNLNMAMQERLDTTVSRMFKMEKVDNHNAVNMIDEVLYEVKDLAMMPFSNILNVFPIMIRDISNKLEKKVDLLIKGETIKVDRRILQEIKDPLIHLLRNSIDHGIETPSERQKLAKPVTGKITLAVTQTDGGKINIEITDDGKGINTETVKNKILTNSLLSEKEVNKLSEKEILEYIFHSGFSTSKIVTELSGRGLGMEIVREKIEKLGGKINITNNIGIGTSIQLKLPVDMATYKGVIVSSVNNLFCLPSMDIERIIKVNYNAVTTIENKVTVNYDGETYPLIDICELLEINKTIGDDQKTVAKDLLAVIIGKMKDKIAIKVDAIIEEREILFKKMGELLQRTKNISGATLLNSGEIVPILNIQDLLKSAGSGILSLPDNVKKTKTAIKKKTTERKKILL